MTRRPRNGIWAIAIIGAAAWSWIWSAKRLEVWLVFHTGLGRDARPVALLITGLAVWVVLGIVLIRTFQLPRRE